MKLCPCACSLPHKKSSHGLPARAYFASSDPRGSRQDGVALIALRQNAHGLEAHATCLVHVSFSWFQSRMRPIQAPQDLRPWFTSIHDLPGAIHWSEFWGNSQPVELDVGCGRGLFVHTASEARPDSNFLGIELDFKEGRRAGTRLWRRRAANARIIGGDATIILKCQIEPHSVDAVHVYFPDPWWKRRHYKRRLFTDEFADLCATILKPGGYLHSWTDVGEYFEVISALMNHHADYEALETPQEHTPEHDMDYRTSFERKKRKLGLPIYRGLWRRKLL